MSTLSINDYKKSFFLLLLNYSLFMDQKKKNLKHIDNLQWLAPLVLSYNFFFLNLTVRIAFHGVAFDRISTRFLMINYYLLYNSIKIWCKISLFEVKNTEKQNAKTIFSSPEKKAQVSFSVHVFFRHSSVCPSVLPSVRPSVNFLPFLF